MPTPDFGPIYSETNFNTFPVEPINTLSNLALLFVASYFASKKDLDRVTRLCAYLLLLSFVGGTVYHACRSHLVWVIIDSIPLILVCIIVTARNWLLMLKRERLKELSFAISVSLVLLAVVMSYWESFKGGSASYLALASLVIPGSFACSKAIKWLGMKSMALAMLTFLIAIYFRESDFTIYRNLWGVGTHFLWHLFGAASMYFALSYLEDTKS